MNYLKILSSLIFTGLILTTNYSYAAGIEVSPSRLEITAEKSQKLTVANPTPDVVLIKIYPDDFKENLEIMPESFTLEAGARKTINITLRKNSEKILGTNLSIVSKPLSTEQFQTNTGVKLPITISQSPASPKISPIYQGIIPALIFILLLITLKIALKFKKS